MALSDVLADNAVFRLDADYFGKNALMAVDRLVAHGSVRLSSVAKITDGIHESLPFIEDGPVKVLSAKHPKDNYINAFGFETIPQAYHDKNPRTSLQDGDVLISTVGTIGNAAVVTKDILPANSDRHVGIVRPFPGDVSPYFLSTFLTGKYGRVQSLREATGNVQLNLFISKIGQLLLPRFSSKFESRIASHVESAYEVRRRAAIYMMQAEESLGIALGLDALPPPPQLSYVRRSKDAFAAGRLDAEYFSPRFVELLRHLSIDGLSIGDVAPVRRERFVPKAIGSFSYIEISAIEADGTAFGDEIAQSEAPSRAAWHVQAGDVITSMVRPIRRLSALIAQDQAGSVCSSGFVVLNPTAIAGEVLLTYLRLSPVCELLDLHTSASLYPAISEQDLLTIPVPYVDDSMEATVVDCVRTAQASRRRAAELLDAAKRAVEIAIEESEASAVEYLGSI